MELNVKYGYLQRWLGGIVRVEACPGRSPRLRFGHLEHGFMMPWRGVIDLIAERPWSPEAWIVVEPDQRRCLQRHLGTVRTLAGALLGYQDGILVTPNGLDLLSLADLSVLLRSREVSGASLWKGSELWYGVLVRSHVGPGSTGPRGSWKGELVVQVDRPYSSLYSAVTPRGTSLHYLLAEAEEVVLPVNVDSVSFRLLGIRLEA